MVRALSSLHKLAAVKRLVTSGTDYWLIQPTWFITYDRSDLFAVKHLSVIGFNTKALLSRSLTLRVSTIFSEIAPDTMLYISWVRYNLGQIREKELPVTLRLWQPVGECCPIWRLYAKLYKEYNWRSTVTRLKTASLLTSSCSFSEVRSSSSLSDWISDVFEKS